MESVLEKICNNRLRQVYEKRDIKSLTQVRLEAEKLVNIKPKFLSAIKNKIANKQVSLIAEIKKQSPSKGLIRENFNPSEIALSYKNAGAACLSVLTEEDYFAGDNEYLIQAKATSKMPVLRKDFILDEYQIYEAKTIGADAILLIAAALDLPKMKALEKKANEIGLDVLVEVHNKQELEEALELETQLIGVNNRNLKTLEVSLNTARNLSLEIPDNRIKVCESGIFTNDEIKEMQNFGYNTFLVGESLMRQENIEKATKELLGLA